MKKKTFKKLSLNRETLQHLNGKDLREAAGGWSYRICSQNTQCWQCASGEDTYCDTCNITYLCYPTEPCPE